MNQNKDEKLRRKIWSEIAMREEDESKERWSIEKWNEKFECYERRRMIKITIINWEVKWEMGMLWEKKKDQKNDDRLRSEMENENTMREEE
jgi:hypothetical protein